MAARAEGTEEAKAEEVMEALSAEVAR